MATTDRPAPPHVERIFDIDPGRSSRLTLPNGVTLWVCGDRPQEDVVRLDMMLRGGRWHQRHLLQAGYTNRMLQEGTRRHTAREVAEAFDYHGAWTDFSCSMLHSYATLYCMGRHFGSMAALLHEVVSEPAFDADELHLQAAIGRQNQRVTLSRPPFRAKAMLASMLFGPEHPAAAYATDADYDRLSPAMLRDFYNRHYNTANTTLLLSGNITDDVIAAVTDLFGRTVTEGDPTPVRGLHRDTQPADDMVRKMPMPDAAQASLRMGMTVPGRDSPDYLLLHILTTVYGGYFGSRLMQNIREQKGYTYGISAGLTAYPDASVLSIASDVNAGHIDDTIAEVRNEMERLCDTPVGDDELEMVRNYMMGELMRSFDGPFYASDARIYLLELGLPDDFYARSVEALRTVTAHDLREVARRYYDPGKLRVAIAGKIA